MRSEPAMAVGSQPAVRASTRPGQEAGSVERSRTRIRRIQTKPAAQVVVPYDVLEPQMAGCSISRRCSHDGLVCRRSRRAPQDGSLRCGESERDIKRGRGPVFVSHTETFHAPATSARPRSAILMLDCCRRQRWLHFGEQPHGWTFGPPIMPFQRCTAH